MSYWIYVGLTTEALKTPNYTERNSWLGFQCHQ